jgi:hypothetical protein
MKVKTKDVYNKWGDLTHIEVLDDKDEFVMQILWDPNDEQTSANRVAFRNWAQRHLEQSQGYEVQK